MRLLTEVQVEQEYGLRVGTLRKWRCVGGGPIFLKIGRSVRYTREDIEAFLQAARRKSTSDDGQTRIKK